MAIVDIDKLKSLNEIVIYKDPNNIEKYFISIDFSSGYGKALLLDPYFKVYKGKSYTQSTEDIRFYLKDGRAGKHNDGKKPLKINNKLIDWIADILKSDTLIDKYYGDTVYDTMWRIMKEYAKANGYGMIEYIPLNTFLENLYEKNYKK